MSKPRIVIHIFHRDLRINDNAALIKAKEKAVESKSDLVTLFIFTPEQVDKTNEFRSLNSIEFMLNSLEDLNTQLHNNLSCIYINQLEGLLAIQAKYSIIAITEQRDYTPFAKQREAETVMFCAQNDIEYIPAEDQYLTNPGTVLNKSGRMFQKYTPFYLGFTLAVGVVLGGYLQASQQLNFVAENSSKAKLNKLVDFT